MLRRSKVKASRSNVNELKCDPSAVLRISVTLLLQDASSMGLACAYVMNKNIKLHLPLIEKVVPSTDRSQTLGGCS